MIFPLIPPHCSHRDGSSALTCSLALADVSQFDISLCIKH